MNIINYTITFDYYEENNSLFYFYLLLVVFLATVLLGLAFLISTLKKSNTLSRTEGLGVYEFGATTIGSSSSSSTNKHYYVLAVLFIIFDVELMILYPFGIAVSDNRLHLGGLILFFLFLLMVGYSYEMVSGALSWYKAPAIELFQRLSLLMGILSKGRAIIGKTGVSFGGMYLLGAGVKIPNKKWFQTMGWAGKENTRKLQILYLNCTIVTTYFVINLIMNWDSLLYKSQFQFVNSAELYYTKKGFAAVFHITNNFLMPTVYIGYDSFALTLTLVSSFLFSVALLSNWNSELMHSVNLFYFLLSWIEACLLIAFSSLDLFIFYICFEGITVPTFFIIYLFGAELTKLRASVVFLLSSFLSSGFITMALVSLYTQMKTSGIYQIMTKLRSTNSLRGSVHFPENGYYTAEDVYTYGLYYLCNFTRYKPVVSSSETGLWEMFLPLNFAQVQYFQPHLSPERILFIWLALFIGFSFKLPICPFHMWLPEAHAEAPTAGSVILAGCILKLGSFGLFRFFLPLFMFFNWFIPLLYTGCLLGTIYASYASLRVNHMKQIVAYSSVAHMGGATIGLFSGYKAGITASLFSFLQHSVTSSSFFIVAGLLYDRYEAYENHFYTGLSRSMPLLAFIDIILLFSNLPFPLFGGFVGEIGFLSVLWRGNILIAIFLLVNQILCTAQTIWYIHRKLFSGTSINFNYKTKITKFMDLTYRDWLILNCLILLSIGPGIRSDIFINLLDTNYFYGNSSYILNYFIAYDEFIDFRDHFVFGKDVIVPFETCGPSGCEA